MTSAQRRLKQPLVAGVSIAANEKVTNNPCYYVLAPLHLDNCFVVKGVGDKATSSMSLLALRIKALASTMAGCRCEFGVTYRVLNIVASSYLSKLGQKLLGKIMKL